MNQCFISKIFDAHFSENTAFNYVDQNRRTKYKELKIQVERQQSFLMSHGVKSGDFVGIAFDNEETILTLFLALISIGAVSVPLNPHLTNNELSKIIKVTPLKYFYAQDYFFNEHVQVIKNDHHVLGLFAFEKLESSLPYDLQVIFHEFKNYTSAVPFKLPAMDKVVTVHFTLKGLGKPLGVQHTYEDYCLSLKSCHDIFNFSSEKKVLGLLPCYPIFGLVTNLLYPLTTGSELIVQDKKIKNILKAINDYDITHVNLVPALMEKLLIEAQKVEGNINLEHVCFVSGGSYMGPELFVAFEKRFNSRPLQGYGLTETLVILTNRPGDSRPGTIGKIMREGVEMKIVDARGFEVPKGKAGEICFKGQGIISEYLGEIENTELLFRSGWLRTGDIAYQTEDEHVVFVGRRLNFTKIQANMVDLKEVEDTLKDIKGIKSVRSYVKTEKGRERLCLALAVDSDFSLEAKDIIDYYRKELSTYKVPSIVKIYET